MTGHQEPLNATVQKFWSELLANITAPTPFMVDRAIVSNSKQSAIVNQLLWTVDPDQSRCLSAFLRDNTLFSESLWSALWALLLSRYSADSQITFAVSSVKFKDTNAIVPLSIEVDSKSSVIEFIQQLQQSLTVLIEAEVPSLEQLQSLSGVDVGTPLVESVVSFNETKPNLPLALQITIGENPRLEIVYQHSRFSKQSIERMRGHLQVMLKAVLDNPRQNISTLPLLTNAERQQILVDWNNSAIDYPDNQCLHHLFEQQVQTNGEAIAVVHENTSLTYAQLNSKANQLANYLRQQGAGIGQLVAIAVSRNLHMPIAMLAAIKSGAAYVPLDPSYPIDRLGFMLEDTQAIILLTEAHLRETFTTFKKNTVLIDSDWPIIEKQDDANVNSGVTALDLAYVIYTSGSTGNPKGAVLNHQGRVNNFCDFNRRYNIGSGDKLLALASISFDMSVYDIFGTLMCGGTVVIADASSIHGAANWALLMMEHNITVWHSVPALMEMLVDHVEGREHLTPELLRLVLLGGDWIPVALPDRLRALVPKIQVVSMGGATEVSMDSTIYDINEPSSKWKSIPYGFPMANQLTYVLDKYLQPLPIGVPGELHLGGVGVGEGYWRREQLTSEKFIANPFRPGERLYKTGDLARYGEDGNLELLGRIDFQVKIRGFRVELGEIESRLRQHPAVRECVMMAVNDSQSHSLEKRIVAYVLTQSEADDSDVRRYLEKKAKYYDDELGKIKEVTDNTNLLALGKSNVYTDMEFAEPILKSWFNAVIEKIYSFRPKRLLTIACDTGCLLEQVAPICEHYHGINLSTCALELTARRMEKLGYSNVRLEQFKEDALIALGKQQFSTIVLQGCISDFPNKDFLSKQLQNLIHLVEPGGVIFLSDIKSLSTMPLFNLSVELFKARSAMDLQKFQQLVKRRNQTEKSLLVDPGYFVDLQQALPEVSAVSIQYKRGLNNTEMSKVCYDVTLYIGKNNNILNQSSDWCSWHSDQFDLERLKHALEEKPEKTHFFCDIPNARIAKEIIAEKLMNSSEIGTVRELRKAIEREAENMSAIDPDQLWRLADSLGRKLEIHYARDGNVECFDAVFFSHSDKDRTVANTGQLKDLNSPTDSSSADSSSTDSYVNNPLFTVRQREVAVELRSYLNEHLPSYMVPSAFVQLDKFPLSPNGKINRRALPEPDSLRPELEQDYVEPKTALEKVLSEFWCQCLGVDKAGLGDGFIALGGNSLSATQVISRIKDIFQIDVPLNYGIHASLQELAQQVIQSGDSQNVNAEETAEIYLEVSAMSEQEIQQSIGQ